MKEYTENDLRTNISLIFIFVGLFGWIFDSVIVCKVMGLIGLWMIFLPIALKYLKKTERRNKKWDSKKIYKKE